MPLFAHHDSPERDMSSTGTGTASAISTHTFEPPNILASFPPLAYFLNTLLIGLNFIRECPFTSLRDKLRHLLEQELMGMCLFVVSVHEDVRAKGKKYLTSLPSNTALEAVHPDPLDHRMDIIYVRCIVKYLLPHVLKCFQLVFWSDTTMTPEGEGQSRRADGSIENTLNDPHRLLPCLVVIMQRCSDCFEAANLTH